MILTNCRMLECERSVISSFASQRPAHDRTETTTLVSRRFDDRCVELIGPLQFPVSRAFESA